jgi:hypothetical protein
MNRVVWQFAKEFSIPFIFAVLYLASVEYWPSTPYGQYVKDFGLAFFFVSWFSGNLVRIWRTDRTQAILTNIQSALSTYERASSNAMKANSALLQEIAAAVRQPAGISSPLVEAARRSVEANAELAAANNATIAVITSSLGQPIIRIRHGEKPEGDFYWQADPRDNGGRPRTPYVPRDSGVGQSSKKNE